MRSSRLPGLASLSAEQTVERALAGYENRDDLVVPGVFNSVQTFSSRLLPRGLLARGAAEAMRRMGRAR